MFLGKKLYTRIKMQTNVTVCNEHIRYRVNNISKISCVTIGESAMSGTATTINSVGSY